MLAFSEAGLVEGKDDIAKASVSCGMSAFNKTWDETRYEVGMGRNVVLEGIAYTLSPANVLA